MSRNPFWIGVAVGTGAGAAAALWFRSFSIREGEMVRVERSVQIEQPAAEVFAACARLGRMPELIRWVVSVAASDDVSYWIADLEGHRYSWDVEIVQVIPNQVIGWKSHRGPRHSGRINFFSLGAHTLVQVDMNCAPPTAIARLFNGQSQWSFGDALEAALHDLKASLEAPRQSEGEPRIPQAPMERSTGTYGPLRSSLPQPEHLGWPEDDLEKPFDDDYV
jgi:uncharacterized membrane protein